MFNQTSRKEMMRVKRVKTGRIWPMGNESVELSCKGSKKKRKRKKAKADGR